MKSQKKLNKLIVDVVLGVICVIWLVPTIGLLVSSFRYREAINTSGWWNVFPHREFVNTETIELGDINIREPIVIDGYGTFDNTALREGIDLGDGKIIAWDSVINHIVGIQEKKWVFSPDFTTENYKTVMNGSTYEYKNSSGDTVKVQGENLVQAFLNSITVAVPATIIPIMMAAFAAYGFSWMNFPGRRISFVIVVMMLVVPLQLALIPILKDYVSLQINGTFLAVWLAHAGFGLPLATYLLYNYISTIPRDILESAFIDGASHFTIFLRLVLPLSVPALASFAIFQFLWVWNDYLVALVFIGQKPENTVLTQQLANMAGTWGSNWHVLTAGAFVSMALPMIVFFALQRYFVRGLMAGSVKG